MLDILEFTMENKKLGGILIGISIVFVIFLIYFSLALAEKSDELNCNVNEGCKSISNVISITNVGFGFFGFMFALGFYILFFNKTEKAILNRLEEEKNKKINDEKFDIILKALDPYENKVLKAIREQDGITQSTLRIRTDMSKAKLSYVLQELEKRNLIKRTKKGKSLAVFLKI